MQKNIKTLVDIDRDFRAPSERVVLSGASLTVPEIISVARHNIPVDLTKDSKILGRIQECYEKMIKDVKDGVPIYGCNTGYGARASMVLADGSPEERLDIAKKMSEGIVHVDVSVGPTFEKDVTRGAILIRINMLMQGVSAVKLKDLETYQQMLNSQITPIVNQFGGVGASGDLAHNGRVLSAARQLEGVMVIDKEGKIREAKEVLSEAGISPLILDPKAGLGLVNGDNFSTSLAALLAVDTLQTLLISSVVGAMMTEVLKGSDRYFHPLLGEVRAHEGQKEVAQLFRYLLEGSQLAYQEMKGHKPRNNGTKIQDGYSLRCIPQYYSVSFEKVKAILDTITINANSVSDNPLWVAPEFATEGEESWQWVSGGNFLAMHMAEAMDSLRKIMTQIVKINDRHLARLVNPNDNNGLPPTLSDDKAISQCAFKAVQTQSGMLEVYSSLLSIPVTTFFGVHEEGNQDITSHALTSGILGMENLKLVRYSLAQNLLAVAQAVDLRGGPEKLSPKTRPVYEFIRERIKYVEEERPLHNDIETIYETIISGELMSLLRDKVLKDFE